MRQHLAYNKSLFKESLTVLAVAIAVLTGTSSAYALTPDATSALQDAMVTSAISSEKMKTMLTPEEEEAKEAERKKYLGTMSDPNSLISKSTRLADIAERSRKLKDGTLTDSDASIIDMKPPPELNFLQSISKGKSAHLNSIIEGAGEGSGSKIADDMRQEAMKEAALSYGARGGLAKRSYQIAERMRDFEEALDKVFQFRSLLIKAPSGLLIEPPIIKESLDALIIENDGTQAALAQGVFDINKKAKIVSAPRDWRHYIIQTWSSKITPPPQTLWPKNDKEQMIWDEWIDKGWQAGIAQADKIFEMNTNRLTADYQGMVRYRMLLAQGMVSAPFATHEERGVTGDGNQMRIGDSALKITNPSQFIIGANTWKPADR